MKTLQRLQDARECEEKTIDALSRILTRTEKLSQQVLTPKEQEWFMPLFRNNINTLTEISKEKRNPKV